MHAAATMPVATRAAVAFVPGHGAAPPRAAVPPRHSRRGSATARVREAHRARSMVTSTPHSTRLADAMFFLSHVPMGGERDRSPQLPPRNAKQLAAKGDDAVESLRVFGKTDYVYAGLRNVLATTRPGANMRQWEAALLRQGVMDGRIFFAGSKGYPASVISVVAYDPQNSAKRRKPGEASSIAAGAQAQVLPDNPASYAGKSFAHLLRPTWCHWAGEPMRAEEDTEPPYDPNELDDPEIRASTHRTVMPLPGYFQSILPYVRVKQLKEELNVQFQQKHPWVHPSLTLSKIRNLKAQVLEQWVRNDQELSTVALAYTLFEKLVAKRVVAKANRKVVMCACLLLAYKFNEFNSQRRPIPDVLQDLEELHGVSPREVLRYEFPVFAWLGFCLHVRTQDMMPHFYRLLKMKKLTAREYLGEVLYAFYFGTGDSLSPRAYGGTEGDEDEVEIVEDEEEGAELGEEEEEEGELDDGAVMLSDADEREEAAASGTERDSGRAASGSGDGEGTRAE